MKILNILIPLLPALICFGPIFMVIGLEGSSPSYEHIVSFTGALMLAVGVCILIMKMVLLEKEVSQLKGNDKKV